MKLSIESIQSLIRMRKDYTSNPNEKKFIPVVYGIDAGFIVHAGISMLSLMDNTNEAIHFNVITNNYDEKKYHNLVSLFSNSNHKLSIIEVDTANISHLPVTEAFPSAIYYRLYSPYLLDSYDYILYLDADIVATNSIITLINDNKPVDAICSVVKELSNTDEIAKNHPEGYFNSGMLYIHTARWINEGITSKVIDALKEHGDKFKYFDQDALNLILNKRVKFINKKYNMQIMASHHADQYKKMPPKDTVLLHYVGQDKPWHRWNTQSISLFYRKYLNLSPWKGMVAPLPVRQNDIKKYYKSLLHQKQFRQSLYWYIKFQLNRLKKERKHD